jgi:U3 small nucleolar RNA-associated protein 14
VQEQDLQFGSTDKLTLTDLFKSINADVEGEANPINATKLRKQFKSLDKEAQKAPALQAPVSGRKRKRQEMDANYNIN